MKRINYALISMALVAFISCSDSSTDPDLEEEEEISESGEITLEITGDYEVEKTGTASFWGAGESSFANDNGNSWQILTSDEANGTISFRLDFIFIYDDAVSRPEPGTYPVGGGGDADSPVFSAAYVNTESTANYISFGAEMCGIEEEYSHTGTLTLETSTPELVSGSFDFEAYYCWDDNVETVTITGEFTAPRSDLID